MRKVLLGLVAAVALGAACFAPLSQASAQWGIYIGNGGGYYGSGFYGNPYRSYYGRGHYGYYPGPYVRHVDRFHYIPGHYHWHRGGPGHVPIYGPGPVYGW